jgi:hypothetical protein
MAEFEVIVIGGRPFLGQNGKFGHPRGTRRVGGRPCDPVCAAPVAGMSPARPRLRILLQDTGPGSYPCHQN